MRSKIPLLDYEFNVEIDYIMSYVTVKGLDNQLFLTIHN